MYHKIFLVFIFKMLNLRGHPPNSLKGDIRQNLKIAYCSESHFKQFTLYSDSQNVFRLRDRQSIKVSYFRPLEIPHYVIRYQLKQNVETSNFTSMMLNKLFLVFEIFRKYFWPLSALNLKGWPLNLHMVD